MIRTGTEKEKLPAFDSVWVGVYICRWNRAAFLNFQICSQTDMSLLANWPIYMSRSYFWWSRRAASRQLVSHLTVNSKFQS